jgi:hypothetical protein
MDDKYNVRKSRKPQTKQEVIQQQARGIGKASRPDRKSCGKTGHPERDHEALCTVRAAKAFEVHKETESSMKLALKSSALIAHAVNRMRIADCGLRNSMNLPAIRLDLLQARFRRF